MGSGPPVPPPALDLLMCPFFKHSFVSRILRAACTLPLGLNIHVLYKQSHFTCVNNTKVARIGMNLSP